MANWTQLHWDMLSLVARKLTDVTDHLTFSAVCSSWRSMALNIRLSFPCPLPGLMLRGEDDHGYFISLSDKRLKNQKLLIPHEDRYVGTYGGWLVTLHKNLDMSLYNPFARERLSLPSATSIPRFGEGGMTIDNRFIVESAALSSSNINVNPKDLTVMIAQGANPRLAFAKPGDSSWQIIDKDAYLSYDTVAFYNGKFFAVGINGTVVCEIDSSPKAILAAPEKSSYLPTYDCTRRYLVESQWGELIMVERYMDSRHGADLDERLLARHKRLLSRGDNGSDDSDTDNNYNEKYDSEDTDYEDESQNDCLIYKRSYMTSFFTAYRMDFVGQQWVPLEGIGDQVFFLGYNTAFSLPAEIGKGNRIYFTDDYVDGQIVTIQVYGKMYRSDMGVFNFNDRSICPHIHIGAAVLYPPPMWAIHLPW